MSLLIGDVAPDFEAETTEGRIRFHEWAGDDWVVFFSHPADFTPVCTTELGYTAKLKDEFAKRGAKALVISVDSLEDHKKWIADIEETQNTSVQSQRGNAVQHDPPKCGRQSHGSGSLCRRPQQENSRFHHLSPKRRSEL